MKHTIVLSLVAVLAWYAPEVYTDGTPIAWETTADILYIPAVSTGPYGPWTDYPMTELLWATLPSPGNGKTLFYSCKAVLYGQSSGYAPSVSLTNTKRGRGKNK